MKWMSSMMGVTLNRYHFRDPDTGMLSDMAPVNRSSQVVYRYADLAAAKRLDDERLNSGPLTTREPTSDPRHVNRGVKLGCSLRYLLKAFCNRFVADRWS